MKNQKKIRVFEAFAGYGSQRMALRNIGIPFEIVGISEIEGEVIRSYAAIHTDFLEKRKNLDKFVNLDKEELIAFLKKLNVPLDYKTFVNRAPKMKIEQLKEMYLANKLINKEHIDGLFVGRSAWNAENFIDLKRKDAHTYIASDGSEFVVDNGCDKEDPKGTIRPEDIQIVSSQDNVENKITGKVIVRTFLGKSYQYELDTPLGVIVVNGSSDHVLQAQDTVCVSLPKGKIVLV